MRLENADFPQMNARLGQRLLALAWAMPIAKPLSAEPASVVGESSAAQGISAQVHIPNRPRTALFQGASGGSSTAISFDPSTQQFTIRLVVQDPHGYFIPHIRRDNFVVFENGVRHEKATVAIEHPPVAVGLLLESGGRYASLNENMADFSESRDSVRRAIRTLPTPTVSELNFYDAMLASLKTLQSAPGRKTLIAITTGIDTFSKASFEDVVRAAHDSATTIYAINLSPVGPMQASVASSHHRQRHRGGPLFTAHRRLHGASAGG